MQKMHKVRDRLGLFILALILIVQVVLFQTSASAASVQEELTEIEISEEEQKVNLVKGEEYILSYLLEGEGWRFDEIKYRLNESQNWEIYDMDLYDEDYENDYIVIEEYKAEDIFDRISLKVRCKTNDLSDIGVVLLNDLTGEVKAYASQTVVTEPELTPTPEPNYPEEPTPSPEPDLEEIDTSGWVFQGISTTYDGKEHVVEVKGLPDWVTPVYNVDNKRTNAGKTVVTVSFEVPEGYKKPADMTAEINIEKAPLQEWILTDSMANVQALDDGTYKVIATGGKTPSGIGLKYTVNGKPVDGEFKITGAGAYIVAVDYDIPEELAGNYNKPTPTKVIYNIKERHNNDWEFDVGKDSWYNEPGKVKVDVGINNIPDVPKDVYGIQYKIEYDKDAISLKTIQLHDGTNGTTSKWNSTDDPLMGSVVSVKNGLVAAYAKSWIDYYAHVADYVFEIVDENADDIVINITGVSLMDMSLKKLPISNVGYVVKNTSTKYELTLPFTNALSTLADMAMNSVKPAEESSKETGDDKMSEEVEENVSSESEYTSEGTDESNNSTTDNTTTELQETIEKQENTESSESESSSLEEN